MINIGFFIRALNDIRRHDRLDQGRNRSRRQHVIGAGLVGEHAAMPADEGSAAQAVLRELAELIENGQWAGSQLSCPECAQLAISVTVRGLTLDACAHCGGLWFDHKELAELTAEPKDILGLDLASRTSRYRCPRCVEPTMREYQFARLHNLMIDRCPRCRGVYLEQGELERCLAILTALRSDS